ncbi:Na+/H+ antiporter NhaC family protein [Lysobacter sp. GX 14042]|uniref:Na+/H+ antiporter NhaC family protein n=1 Tax=Lysobacter sp. GX 14042 TaxID=2907155 RepID=UPI001F47381A|nr:Na+/H+ antiporter NhaC family protein [Lysobacter sp. GX 14042]MCE7032490.1 Na+/H+ antiporter NhaC family protein [Lysobacter sp. GX 14042]
MKQSMPERPSPSALALTPLLLFLSLFFGVGLYFTLQGEEMGFYRLQAPVAALPALALGAWLLWRRGGRALDTLLEGMGQPNVMLMVLVFLLAGAFANVSRAIGAVDAVVALGLGALPPELILPALFLVAGFVSLAIGTSMGTIAAVVPVAVGIADAAGLDMALVLGAVVGGAMFGDNLSIISDTTIAATRTQGARMNDKFRENLKLAVPAALATALLLAWAGEVAPVQAPVQAPEAAPAWLVAPYVLVLALALAGVNVVVVLAIGLVVAGVMGAFAPGSYDPVSFGSDIYAGFESMVEITLLSILIGGLAAMTRAAGGLEWMSRAIARLARGGRSRRMGEASIAALAAGSDVLTANNTVAILVSGELARDIAARHDITPRRAAAVLDVSACVAQGVLPYGAQILLAGSLAGISPLLIVGKVWYCWALAAAAAVAIAWPRRSVAPPPAQNAAQSRD